MYRRCYHGAGGGGVALLPVVLDMAATHTVSCLNKPPCYRPTLSLIIIPAVSGPVACCCFVTGRYADSLIRDGRTVLSKVRPNQAGEKRNVPQARNKNAHE